MHLRLGLALGVLLAVLVPATALAGPTVTVRVEGAAGTLLPAKQVTLGDVPYSAGSATCPADSAFAALDTAIAGNWDRANFFNTVLGETHNFSDSDYWAVWVGRAGGYLYGNGVCSQALQPGDELLLLVDRSPPPSYSLTVFPLKLSGVPAIVAPGAPFTVKVDEYRPDAMGTPGSGTRRGAGGRHGRCGFRQRHDGRRRDGDAHADDPRPGDGARLDAGHALAARRRLRHATAPTASATPSSPRR